MSLIRVLQEALRAASELDLSGLLEGSGLSGGGAGGGAGAGGGGEAAGVVLQDRLIAEASLGERVVWWWWGEGGSGSVGR